MSGVIVIDLYLEDAKIVSWCHQRLFCISTALRRSKEESPFKQEISLHHFLQLTSQETIHFCDYTVVV